MITELEYQIERLHILGDEDPSSGLKTKVKRWQFSQAIDVEDTITREIHKEPMKPFMVNQLVLCFERDRMIMSPFDNILFNQLQDYEMVRMSQNGSPIFTSENEHYVDALGLAYLAMVLEFKELTGTVQEVETSSKIEFSTKSIGQAGINEMFRNIQESYSYQGVQLKPSDDLRGDRQTWVKVPISYRSGSSYRSNSWSSRSNIRGGGCGRSMW